MIKRTVYIVLLLFISANVFSQQKIKIDLKQTKQNSRNTESVKNISNGLRIVEKISTIDLVEKQTKEGNYSQIITEGLSKTYDKGKPDLPVVNRLIEIPFNSTAKVKVLGYDEEIIELKDHGLTKSIIPAQPSYEKSKDLRDVPFYKDKEVYSKNEFYKKNIVKFEDKGYLRDKHLGYIEISPFAYNPVTNSLKILNNIEVEVTFIPKNSTKAKLQSVDRLKSPFFEKLPLNTINSSSSASTSKSLLSAPIKYVIVSDPMFKETLQPFIQWKIMKGFNVIEAYTDVIGTTTTDIKSYLQDLYENPDDGVSPTFVLFVGDVAQIPTFSGNTGSHYTDLYYCEYTGDNLPDVFYGRFSAESIEELQPQIDKTLEVEKYEMPDPSYLDNVVLVAGVDASNAPTYGNGAINYANNNYTNAENGINSYYYLYNDASGVMASNSSGASASIRSYISSGVSFANYTAHCSSSGWADPSFSISNIDDLTNNHMYPLIIGNCCQSNTFYNNDCFGEKILMAANKGAVGYIGGSDLTYWDEDYYWGIGLTSTITANPTYETSGLGAYDRFFHLNGEPKEEWYVTQGQINFAGNLAVEASTSSRKAYYWEIYNLMGDPSLTPYVKVPEALMASYKSEIVTKSTSFHIIAEEGSYVAISKDGVLLDVQLVDATGEVNLSFDELTDEGELDLVITKQNRQPIIDKVNIISATTPYVTLDNYTIDDTSQNNNSEVDFGETIKLNVQLKNLSDNYDAFNVRAYLRSSDTNVVITDSILEFETIYKADTAFKPAAYTINFKNKFSDQQNINFNIDVLGSDVGGTEYTWTSRFSLTVNAPELEIGDLFVEDTLGNDNGILDPGETANISLVVINNGNAAISNLNGIASILSGEGDLILNNSESGSFTLDSHQTDTISFNATAGTETKKGTAVFMSFLLDDVANKYYSKSQNKELNIGEIPEIKITDKDTSISGEAYFYDSGGSAGNYTDNENDTITLYPAEAGKFLVAEFENFSVESNGSGCYDYLDIYDGENTNANLIGSYCDSKVPSTIQATNESGMLTFAFYSDESVDRSGWKAIMKSVAGYDYNLTITDKNGPLQGAIVELNGKKDTTNVSGSVVFNNVPEGIDYPVKITAEGHDDIEKEISLFEDTNDTVSLKISEYDITFNLYDVDGAIDGSITFNGQTLETSGGEITFSNVEYGLNKEYSIQSYGHKDSIASVDVTSNLNLDVVLNVFKFDIEFVISDGTDPVANAIVELDSAEALTNIDGVATFTGLKMGSSLPYYVRKTGYDNQSGTVDIKNDSIIHITMSQGVATFKVTFNVDGEGNPVYNAQVVLGDDTLYTDPLGNAVFNNIKEENNIPYKISKPHFNDIEGSINLSGDNVVIDTNLTYKQYQIKFKVYNGSDPLENAVISFDGKNGSTDSKGEYVFEVVYSLNKTYSVSKEKFHDVTGMINVDSDKNIDVSMSMITYGVKFIVTDNNSHAAQDVLVDFNSENKYTDSNGEALFTEVLPGEDLSFKLSKEGFWDYDSTLNVDDSDVEFNAQLSATTNVLTINEQNIKIYPNPSEGIFNLEIRDLKNRTCKVKVFNVIGSVVYSQEINAVPYIKEKINISNKAKGIYFLSVEADDGSIISKRIIVK